MRVLQVHCRYRLAGGEDAVVDQEAASLRAAGHEVETVTVHNPDGAVRTAAALAAAPWNARAAAAVRARATAWAPDVVHVHNTWFALSPAVLPALHDAGLPTVQTVHNHRLLCVNAELFRDGQRCHDCVGRSPLPGVRHRCYRSSAAASAVVAGTILLSRRRAVHVRHVDAVITPSQAARSLLLAGGLPPGLLHVVPNPVTDRGARSTAPASSTTVLYVGRLIPAKGLDLLLDAWTAARPGGLTLEVAGEGALADRVRSTPGAVLLGRLSPEEVAARMRRARAVVVPSVFDEPFGLVVAEAFAAGTPVLASRSGALPELLAQAGSPHWVVDENGWAGALTALTGSDDLDAAGLRGRAAYERCWTPERSLDALLRVYAVATGRE